MDDSVSFRCFLGGIAQDRVIEVEGFGEFGVFFDRVATCGEVSDVAFLKVFATLTERLAFLRSTTGKGLGIPGNHHRGALQIGQHVGFAVAAGEFEIGGGIALLQIGESGRSRQGH